MLGILMLSYEQNKFITNKSLILDNSKQQRVRHLTLLSVYHHHFSVKPAQIFLVEIQKGNFGEEAFRKY